MAEPDIIVSDLRSPYGIAFDADDVLFVSESGANRIVRVEDGQAQPFAQTGPRPLGIAFDDSGDLFVAESGRHHLILISPDEAVEVYAHSCRGRRFISPRQLCFAPTGDVLFSDSGHEEEGDGSVYRADLDGEVTEVVSGLSAPAGMVLSEDAAVLYVSERGRRRILSLEMDDDGRLRASKCSSSSRRSRAPRTCSSTPTGTSTPAPPEPASSSSIPRAGARTFSRSPEARWRA